MLKLVSVGLSLQYEKYYTGNDYLIGKCRKYSMYICPLKFSYRKIRCPRVPKSILLIFAITSAKVDKLYHNFVTVKFSKDL